MSATKPVIPQDVPAGRRPLTAGVGRVWVGRLAVLLPALVLGLVVWPLIVAHGQLNGEDYPTHLWFIWHQAEALRQDLRPSLFAAYDDGVFYPQYAFYGGTLYALTGALALVVGEGGRGAYVIAHLAGFAAAYGGWTWLGRMAGLGRWRAQAPAIVFVTSAYMLTNIYTRGDWAEFMAISALPLFVAASLSVLRAGRLRAAPVAALVAATVVFTGSHALTLLYGSLFLVLLLGLMLAVVPPVRRLFTRAGIRRWLGIVVPSTLVNAWFLWPLAAYANDTRIGTNHADMDTNLRSTALLTDPQHIFALGRESANAALQEFVLVLPVLAMAWVVVTLTVLLARRRGALPWIAGTLVLVLAGGALLVVMTHVGIVLALPTVLHTLQFTYRLESYIIVCVSGALVCALAALPGRGWPARLWIGTLFVVLGLSTLGAASQVRHHLRGDRIYPYERFSFAVGADYVDSSLPLVAPSALPIVSFPPSRAQDDTTSVTTTAGPGQYVVTNILSLSRMIHIDGAHPAALEVDPAVTGTGVLPHMVLKIDGDAIPGAARITVSEARSLPIVGGRWLSLLGILGVLANFAVIAVRYRRYQDCSGTSPR